MRIILRLLRALDGITGMMIRPFVFCILVQGNYLIFKAISVVNG